MQPDVPLDLFGLLVLYATRNCCLLFFCGRLCLGFCCLVFQEIISPNNQLVEQEPKRWELFEDCVKDEPASERKHRFPDENGPELRLTFFLKAKGCCGAQPGFNTRQYHKACLGEAAGACDAQRPSLPRRLKFVCTVPTVSRCLLCTAWCFWPSGVLAHPC